MDEEELQRIYDAHRDRGASESEALAAVELARQGGQTSPELEAQKRIANSTLSPAVGGALDFAQLLGHGASLGLTGLLAGPEARQHVRDLRETSPKMSAATEIAGGAFIPLGAGGSTMAGGRGMLAGMLAGAGSGAVAGGVQGAAEADPGQRMDAAKRGALIGAAVGAPLGAAPSVVNSVIRGGKGAAGQLSKVLRKTTGVEDDLFTAASKAQLKEAVAGAELGALDEANQAITDPRVLAALDPKANRFLKRAVNAVEPGGFSAPTAPSVAGLKIPPLTSPEERATIELQRVLEKMRAEGKPVDADNIGTMYQQILENDPVAKLRASGGAETVTSGGGGGKAPSLVQIRTVLQELKDASERAAKKPRTTIARGYSEARSGLKDVVEDVVPGFKAKNRAYAQSQSRIEGLGFKSEQGKLKPQGGNLLSTKSADEGKIALQGQYPEMQEGMRARFVNDIASSLGEGGGEWLRNMVSRQPETLARLRNAFPDDEAGSVAYRKLLRELALQQSAARTVAGAKKTAIGAGIAGVLGGGGYAIRSLLSGPGAP